MDRLDIGILCFVGLLGFALIRDLFKFPPKWASHHTRSKNQRPLMPFKQTKNRPTGGKQWI